MHADVWHPAEQAGAQQQQQHRSAVCSLSHPAVMCGAGAAAASWQQVVGIAQQSGRGWHRLSAVQPTHIVTAGLA